MKTGDILLFRGKGLIAQLIKWGTNSQYSHCAVCIDAQANIMVEAKAGLVRATDIRKEDDYDIYRVKAIFPYDLQKVTDFLVSRLNARYDYLGVFYLGFLKLLNKIGIPLQAKCNAFQKDKDYFCSELVCEAFREGGVTIVKAIWIASPKDIVCSEKIEFIGRR